LSSDRTAPLKPKPGLNGLLVGVLHLFDEVTLRRNEYGVCASGSSGHPLPGEFASCESLSMSV
jgi:hypothetical protein